jgi:broad specificity phosphatase PhoE
MTTRIFFVRHGDVVNPKNIFYGRLPGFTLSPTGKKQIQKTAQALARNSIDAIYASPLLRTKQSALIIANTLRLPVNYSDNLLEVDTSAQGNTFDYISTHWPNINIYSSSENKIIGETIGQLSNRIREFIIKMNKSHPGKNIVAVSHGDPIMIARVHAEKLPIKLESLRPDRGYIQKGEIYIAEFNSQ